MTTYIKIQNYDLSYTGSILKKEDDGSAMGFNSTHHTEWQLYQDWIAEGNTPGDQYSLDDIKQVCYQYADQLYEQTLLEPVTFNSVMYDCSIEQKSKMHNAKATGRSTVKLKKKGGKSNSISDTGLDGLLDAIENRDDVALDDLDDRYDAIEAAEDISDLTDYLPPQV